MLVYWYILALASISKPAMMNPPVCRRKRSTPSGTGINQPADNQQPMCLREAICLSSKSPEKSVKDLSYRFKYFQNIEGDIELPEGFKPLRMSIEILPRGRERDKIEKSIPWPNEESTTHVGKKQET